MMWTRRELKTRAKAVLRAVYWKAFLVSLIIAFVGNSGGFPGFGGNFGGHSGGNGAANSPGPFFDGSASHVWLFVAMIIGFVLLGLTIALAFRILLGYPLEVGGRRYFIQAAQGNSDLNALGYAFEKGKYLDIIKAMLWRGVLNFLWFLLLIIPGIVKSYAYRMVPYILADNPNIGYKRALELSNKMTKGEKFKMWVLDLSFIGWYLLGFLALFVGTLFVMPYENATKAELYLVLRQKALESGLCTPEELGFE